MAQVKTKFIEDGAVNEDKILLSNDSYLKGRNQADSGNVDIVKVNASDNLELAAKLNDPSNAAPTADTQLANKKYVDDSISAVSLPSVFELQGNWSAATNMPALDNTDTGVDNYLYYCNAAGSVDFGAGSITFAVGDWVYNNGSTWEKADNNDDVLSVAGKTGVVTLDTDDVTEGSNLYYTQTRFDSAFTAKDTDDLSEGSTNFYYTEGRFNTSLSGKDTDDLTEGAGSLYHTTARARTAAVVNSTAGTETDQAASVAAMKSYVDAASGSSQGQEVLTLAGGDITAQNVSLAQSPLASSATLSVSGVDQTPGVDFSISGSTLSFLGDLATAGAAALIAGDVLVVKYEY